MGALEEIIDKICLLRDEEMEQLNKELLIAYGERKRIKDSATASFLKRGDKVNWKSRNDLFMRNATILRINKKTCTVKNKIDGKEWRIGFSFIKKGWI